MLKKLASPCALALGVLLFSGLAFGQVTTGTILGTVHDTTGAAVVGAKVTITETAKGTVSEHDTGDDGDYNVPFLIPGTYSEVVQKEGFKRSVSQNILLDVDKKALIDVT